MTQASPQPPPTSWPPLVTTANRPAWIIIRDVLLTLIAWGVLAWMLRDPIYVAFDYLRHPIFQLTTARPLDLNLLWHRLDVFFAISAALIVLLFVSGVIDRRRLRAAEHHPQPPQLTTAEQARQFKLEEHALLAAHHYGITKVHFADDGSISSLGAGGAANGSDAVNRADEPAEMI